MQVQEIFDHLKKHFPEHVLELVSGHAGDPFLVIAPEAIAAVAAFARSDSLLELDQLMCLSGVDYPPERLEVVYHLHSTSQRHRVVLKVRLDRQQPSVPSVSLVWRTANWHEREAYDLFGIVFTSHPNLRRILLPPDWAGHPLRKDYVFPTEYRGIKCHD